MAQQIDQTPSTVPGIHFHAPNGASGSQFNNPSDFPSVTPGAGTAKGVAVKVTATQGAVIRFANPS